MIDVRVNDQRIVDDHAGATTALEGQAFVADEHDAGTPVELWQQGLAQFQSLSLDDAARLVVIAPHPDDEVLGAGGLMADLASSGREVLVIGVTDGEGLAETQTGLPPAALARVRRAESERACAVLGVPPPRRLGLPDGHVANVETELARTLGSLLQPGDVVACTWRADGHPDHEATARATLAACRPLGLRLLQYPVWMWHWSRPDDPRVPWNMARQWQISDQGMSRKQAAVAEFASQLATPERGAPVLGPMTIRRLLQPREIFLES